MVKSSHSILYDDGSVFTSLKGRTYQILVPAYANPCYADHSEISDGIGGTGTKTDFTLINKSLSYILLNEAEAEGLSTSFYFLRIHLEGVNRAQP